MAKMILYLTADVMLIVACAIMHVTMMRRFHARRDLKFRGSLLALAAFFFVCGGAYFIDLLQILRGETVAGGWARLLAGVVSLAAAIVVAQPDTHRYYMNIQSPETTEHHLREIVKLHNRLAERERDVRGSG